MGTPAGRRVPLGIAFLMGRRPQTRRYTYRYGRAEDLAGAVVVVLIVASRRWPVMRRPGWRACGPATGLIAVAVASVTGFEGNEVVARYPIWTGRKTGSATLVADGLHARTDGFTSLTVLLTAGGTAIR
ncbi:MAG TPA: cation transporter [Streptosporangiaceae bacterium]